MKKIALLMAVLLFISVSGVYAAWLYTDSNADIVDKHYEAVVTMTDAIVQGASGTLSISCGITLKIDQEDPNSLSSKKAVLRFYDKNGNELTDSNNSDPVLTVTFTPAVNADPTVKENGVPAELYFKTTSTMLYGGREIFSFSNKSDGNFEPNIVWGSPDSQGVFTATYTYAQLKSMITLAEVFELPTKADYDAFSEGLGGNIGIYVTDGNLSGSVQG